MISFGLWGEHPEDIEAFRRLFQRDDIFDPQRRDGDTKEMVLDADFPGCYLALFRGDDIDGQTYGPIGYIMFFPKTNTGVFEQHTAFVTEARGAVAMRLIELAIAKLFIDGQAIALLTTCPAWNPAAAGMARKMGGSIRYRKDQYALRDGQVYGADIYGMTILDWAYKNHPGYGEIGHRWHEQVFSKLPEAKHDDDDAHDGILGIALKVGERRPHLGLGIYNAWAEIAGYAQATLIWADGNGNSLIDIDNAYVVNLPDGIVAAVIPKCPPPQPS